MLEDLNLLIEPDPTMIESLYNMTGRDRTEWDAETLLILAIKRKAMDHLATKEDCEQPYVETDDFTDEELEERNASVVGSFFKRVLGTEK